MTGVQLSRLNAKLAPLLATPPAATTTARKEHVMAKKDSTAAAKPAKTPKVADKRTRAQVEKVMKDNLPAYKAYQVDRGKGVERSKNKHRVGYQAYKNAYRRLLEIKKAAGEIKPRGQKTTPAQEPTAS